LLDYRLPGWNALELLKDLRQVHRLDVPVVLVTGQGDEEVAVQALKVGASDYVPKTAGYLQRLPDVLEDAYHRHQLAQEQAALRASEAALTRYAAELERRVAERTAGLTAANARLEELSRLKSDFVSNVSHELRTPLANIITYLDLLDHGRPEKREQYMATLKREARLLQVLIEDLLQISRLDLGRAGPVMAPVDVNALVTQLVGDRTRLFADHGLTLRAETRAGLPCVPGDQKMLVQVLTNLMTNAMNYTPAGGTVTLRTSPGMGGFGQTDGAWVACAVSDDGPGITPEEQARLFERFYRGAAARRSGALGTGLGLAICQEIMARHGGHLTVESTMGQGSTFTLWLPLPTL
jgi:phosphoserine phosphatase RsbU/P